MGSPLPPPPRRVTNHTTATVYLLTNRSHLPSHRSTITLRSGHFLTSIPLTSTDFRGAVDGLTAHSCSSTHSDVSFPVVHRPLALIDSVSGKESIVHRAYRSARLAIQKPLHSIESSILLRARDSTVVYELIPPLVTTISNANRADVLRPTIITAPQLNHDVRQQINCSETL